MQNQEFLAGIDLVLAKELFDNDKDFYLELCEVFLRESEQNIANLAATVAREDSDGVRKGAHFFKGSLLNLAASKASSQAAILEEAAEQKRLTEYKTLLEKFTEEVAQFVKSVEQIKRSQAWEEGD